VDNPELGEWLVSIRQQLLAWQSIEALDEKKTAAFLALFGQASGPVVAAATVQFAVDCATGVATHFPSATRQRLRSGSQIGSSNDALRPVFGSVNALLSAPTPGAAHRALLAISRLPDVRLYCREAWREVLDALRYASSQPDLTATDALARVRNQARLAGRRLEPRVVSRPLLVKGLEYKHVVILDADQYTAVELYVALTRGSKSLTVISRQQTLTPVPARRSSWPVWGTAGTRHWGARR
jgi:hypothetical protein